MLDGLSLDVEGSTVHILVVQDNRDLGAIWCRFLTRHGVSAHLATSEAEAIEALEAQSFDALVLEPVLDGGGGLCVADIAAYRQPDLPIIAVTKSEFFSDGSIFSIIPNARGFLRTPVRPEDLFAYLEHCTTRKPEAGQIRA